MLRKKKENEVERGQREKEIRKDMACVTHKIKKENKGKSEMKGPDCFPYTRNW